MTAVDRRRRRSGPSTMDDEHEHRWVYFQEEVIAGVRYDVDLCARPDCNKRRARRIGST